MEEQKFNFTKSLTVGSIWNTVASSMFPPLCRIENLPLATEKLVGRQRGPSKLLRNEKILWRLLEVESPIPVASRYTVLCFATTKDPAKE